MNFKRWESVSVVVVVIGVVGGAVLTAVVGPIFGAVGTAVAAFAGAAKHFLGKAADREHKATARVAQGRAQSVERADTVIAVAGPMAPGVHGEIDDAWKYVGRGQPQVTVDLLEKIKKRSWDRLSARERYRVLANIGNAKLTQRDFPGAAQFYLKSVRHQPSDPDARALEALAYQLLEKRDKAYELATALVADEPELSRAHMIQVRNAPESVSVDQLLGPVPDAVRGHPEVALALHDRALGEGRLAEAEQILRDSANTNHGWGPLTLALGSTVLQQETAALKMTLDGPIVLDVDRVSEARDLFSQVLDEIPEGDPESLAFSAHLNRGTAHRLLDEKGVAHKDFRRAYELRPSDVAAVIHFAKSAYPDRDDPDEAIAVLKAHLRQHDSIEVELLLAECLWHREGEGDFDDATKILEGLLPRVMGLEQANLRTETVAILVNIYIREDRGDDALGVFEGLPEGALEVPMQAAIRGEVFRKLGRTDEAIAEGLTASEALGDSVDWNLVRHVALLLERLDRYREAFELWRRVATPKFVSTETMHLLRAARQAGEDKFVIEFCRQLRQAGQYDHRALSQEVEVLTSYSEFKAAREAFLDYLNEKPDDKVARLNLTLLAIQLGWDDLIEGDPSSFPTVEELGDAEIGALVADVLRAGPDPIQAVNYAYDLYQRFPDQAAAHRALIVSALAPGPAGFDIQKPEQVALGVAVCYAEEGDEERRWLVVEDSENASLTRKEYRPTHPLAVEMMGKSVGDEFALSVDAIRNPSGTILEVLDKRVYRANELLTGWKERFPDKPQFEAVPIRASESPTPDFSEMLAVMKRLSENRERVEQAYADGRLPITTMAEFNGKTVFETMTYLAANLELPVRASRGTAQDRSEAIDALDDADTVVLGPSAIATLALIEELDLLDLLPARCLVTEGAIRELRVLSRGDGPQASGHMGYKNGRLWIEEVDEERETERLERLKEALASFEASCEIIGGMDLADVDAKIRGQLAKCVTRGAAESAAAASRRGAVFWSDDHLLCELVKGDLPLERVWTDVVFQWAFDKGLIDQKRRSRLVARLLRHGYFFTASNSIVVLDTCEAALWRPEDPYLAAILADFGSSAWAPMAALQITREAIAAVWRHAPTEEHARAVTARLLTHLGDREDRGQIIRSLLGEAEALLGLAVTRADALQQVLQIFAQGGILTL